MMKKIIEWTIIVGIIAIWVAIFYFFLPAMANGSEDIFTDADFYEETVEITYRNGTNTPEVDYNLHYEWNSTITATIDQSEYWACVEQCSLFQAENLCRQSCYK